MSSNHDAIKNLPAWHEARGVVLDRDDHTCQQCGSEDDLTVDHVTPLDVLFAYGITPEAIEWACDPANLVTLCRSCNSRKNNTIGPGQVERHTWVSPIVLGALGWLYTEQWAPHDDAVIEPAETTIVL